MNFPIYVVSVRSFTDRHRHMEQIARTTGLTFEYVWEYDADQLDNLVDYKVDINLRPASISNVLKHLEAQRKFLETESNVALILEDDVILYEGFCDKLKEIVKQSNLLESGWLIFLGGADNKVDSRFLEAAELGLVESPITTAEAYLVDRRGCELRRDWLSKNTIDRQADHQLKVMDSTLLINHYCVTHPMATQGSLTGLFQTALDSSRAKRSPRFLRLRFEYNKFRRQTMRRFLASCRNFLRKGRG